MDRPPQPPAKDAPDRTQTIQSRDRSRDRTPEPGADPARAATQLGKGTPTWQGEPAAGAAPLPIDDPERYALVGEHARGGLGRVVRAVDQRLGRTVAVKELLKKNETAEALFVREALITARLQHPGIVPVIEAGRWPNGEPYYVMKLVEGRSLKELIGERATLDERLALLPHVIAVAEAIGYAHSQDVIHRDVKPANVVVGEFGETVVVDWGLARDGRRDAAHGDLSDEQIARGVPRSGPPRGDSAETVSGRVIGTPQYMSPEQARGEVVDARADVYSLGALLYEVLAGIAPYSGGDADTILSKVVAGPPRPLADHQPDAPPDLLAIVAKAMSRDPADRYPTAKELAEDLKRFATGQLVTAHRYGAVQLAKRWVARNRVPVAVAGIAAVVMVLVAIGMIRRIVEERNIAQDERSNAVAAERDAEERSNALRAVQAESSVRRDPTAAVAWLKQLTIDPARAGVAATILDEAIDAGVARHVFRETDWVFDVEFSPDGRLLATASKDGQVRVYDLGATPPRVTVLGEHPGGVTGVVFVDGGRALVTGGTDGRVVWWPVAGGPERVLGTLDTTIERMTLAPNDVLRVFSDGDDIALYQMPGGETIVHVHRDARLTGLVGGDVSPVDAERWVVGYTDGRLTVLDKGNPVAELPKLERPARTISFTPDGRRVAVYDGAELHLYDVEARKRSTIGRLAAPVRFATWSPDGTTLAIGGEMPELHVFSATGGEPRVLRGHTDPIYLAEFTDDGRRILTAGDDGTARVWDLVTGGVEILRGHEDDVYSATFSADETMVATASLDGTARVWPVGASGVRVLGGDVDAIMKVKPIDERTVLTVSSPFQVHRWNLETGERAVVVPRVDAVHKVMTPGISERGDVVYPPGPSHDLVLVRPDGTRHLLRGHTAKLIGGGFTGDGKWLLSASWDGTIRRWDLETGAGSLVSQGAPIEGILMAPTGDRYLLIREKSFTIVGLDGTVHGTLDRALPGALYGRKVFSPDASRLVIAGKPGASYVWTPATGALVTLEAVGHHATNVTFSPDGARLAGAMADRTVRIWDVATGKLVDTFEGHLDLVMNVDFAPDGKHLASVSFDRTVRVWNVETGQARVLRGHGGPVETVHWLDDGKQLLTGSRDGTLRVWPMPSTKTPAPDELRLAIERATTAVVGAGEEVASPLAR